MDVVSQRLNSTLSSLSLKWMWRANISTGLGFSERNVWSRASRRQSTKVQSQGDDMEEDEAEMTLGFKVNLEDVKSGKDGSLKITIRWLKGHDSVLFESFCGMLKRKMEV